MKVLNEIGPNPLFSRHILLVLKHHHRILNSSLLLSSDSCFLSIPATKTQRCGPCWNFL